VFVAISVQRKLQLMFDSSLFMFFDQKSS
jgi:hypothetical protein